MDIGFCFLSDPASRFWGSGAQISEVTREPIRGLRRGVHAQQLSRVDVHGLSNGRRIPQVAWAGEPHASEGGPL